MNYVDRFFDYVGNSRNIFKTSGIASIISMFIVSFLLITKIMASNVGIITCTLFIGGMIFVGMLGICAMWCTWNS